MTDRRRREFLRQSAGVAGAAAALSIFPPSIRRALSLPAQSTTGTIRDVQHVVILIQENRSFDHYFGTLRGVRGFGDRHTVPSPKDRLVWQQSDGEKLISPFRLDTRKTSALRTPGTPHTYSDAQGAWNQGRLDRWPVFKTPFSMGYYTREDIPFQFALAEAFTLCDAYHCSVTTGTDPNRIVIWSGSNFDPQRRARGENCTAADAEVNNLRCAVEGTLPEPGYVYQGSAFTWPTIPDLLEQAGVSWRIYQDPNNNWSGLMHGTLAFKSFREAKPGDPIYDKGMTLRSIEQLRDDVKAGALPQVTWILPTMLESEHPSPSSSLQGAEFTAKVLDALTSNPQVWGRTVLFLTFDENDGLFDHAPPPAPPSYNDDGSLAGKSTLDLKGLYFDDKEAKYRHAHDTYRHTTRPWGLGPRVPLYVISPWSKGGWVNSQVFDHTSIGQFIEKRFGVTVPAISPWHRAVSGDLTGTFDFVAPNDPTFPALPQLSDVTEKLATAARKPKPAPPERPEMPLQERGLRRSRALPYQLHVDAEHHARQGERRLAVHFRNTGAMGAVFHVYDRLHLERIPRRYTVEAGKHIDDAWQLEADDGRYDLWVYGPNGFVREFRGALHAGPLTVPSVVLQYDPANLEVELVARNPGAKQVELEVLANAYHAGGPWRLRVAPAHHATWRVSVIPSQHWYDLTVVADQFERRFAGRLENGKPSYGDPAV